MLYHLYNYLFPDYDYNYVLDEIEFYENKINQIQNQDINEENKLIRIKKFQFILNCIKYKYNL